MRQQITLIKLIILRRRGGFDYLYKQPPLGQEGLYGAMAALWEPPLRIIIVLNYNFAGY